MYFRIVDNVMFSHNAAQGPESVCRMAAPEAKTDWILFGVENLPWSNSKLHNVA